MRLILLVGLALALGLVAVAPAASATNPLVDDVLGCAHVFVYGGTYWGNYMACRGPGPLP